MYWAFTPCSAFRLIAGVIGNLILFPAGALASVRHLKQSGAERSHHQERAATLKRRLIEAGTRVVEVIWPKVANSDNHSWDHHSGLNTFGRFPGQGLRPLHALPGR